MTTVEKSRPTIVFLKSQRISLRMNQSRPLELRLTIRKEPAGQAAVTMYCLSALQHFEDKDLDEIQKVGFEIGLLGTKGIDPSKQNKKFTLKSIPAKNSRDSNCWPICMQHFKS